MKTKLLTRSILSLLAFGVWPLAFAASNQPPPTCDGTNSQCNANSCFEYSYQKTAQIMCPQNTEKLIYKPDYVLPPVVLICDEAGIGRLTCVADPEGVNTPVSFNWRTTTPGATVSANGMVRCNAGFLVTASVDVSNGYNTQSADVTMTCPDFNN